MSDEPQDTSVITTGETPAETSEWTPPTSQAELDRIIQNRLERERAKYADYDDLREKAQSWDQIEEASKTEYERIQEEATRWQTEASTWRTKAVSSQVQTLAAAEFADPTDALAAIGDPAKYLGAGGEIDEAAIKADLDALLERKPHWRKAEGAAPGPRVPAPNPAQGSGVDGRAANDPAQQFAALINQQLAQR
jgi:hypothetical protein